MLPSCGSAWAVLFILDRLKAQLSSVNHFPEPLCGSSGMGLLSRESGVRVPDGSPLIYIAEHLDFTIYFTGLGAAQGESGRTAVPLLAEGLLEDPEEDTGVGDRVGLLRHPEPVQALPNDLSPGKVCHGQPNSWLGERVSYQPLSYQRRECYPCTITLHICGPDPLTAFKTTC